MPLKHSNPQSIEDIPPVSLMLTERQKYAIRGMGENFRLLSLCFSGAGYKIIPKVQAKIYHSF